MTTESSVADQLADELNRFRERLLDQSRRNALLNYRKSAKKTLEITGPSIDQIYEWLVVEGKKLVFNPLEDKAVGSEIELVSAYSQNGQDEAIARNLPTDRKAQLEFDVDEVLEATDSVALQTKLNNELLLATLCEIVRASRSAIEETGVNYLYMALGWLAWKEKITSEQSMMAPLILIPIRIEHFRQCTSNRSYVVSWTEEDVQSNLCLAKRLERDHETLLPQFEEKTSPAEYFDLVAKVANRRQLPWEVRKEALLGFFSYQKLLMYRDTDPQAWIQNGGLTPQSIAGKIILGNNPAAGAGIHAADYDIDENELAQRIELALDADSSQHSALCDIASGKNLVIEGPPGTGKSQTITNAIAWALRNGKRILFVAEKLAALQVVSAQLQKVGLHDFCLELHSDAAKPGKVVESLKKRLAAEFASTTSTHAARTELENKK